MKERLYSVTGHVHNSVDGTGDRHHGQQCQQQQNYVDQVPVIRLPPDCRQTHMLYPTNASQFNTTTVSPSAPAFDVPVATAQGLQTTTARQLSQPQSFAVPGQVNVAPVSAAPGAFFHVIYPT